MLYLCVQIIPYRFFGDVSLCLCLCVAKRLPKRLNYLFECGVRIVYLYFGFFVVELLCTRIYYVEQNNKASFLRKG